jgi:hypothetical protein
MDTEVSLPENEEAGFEADHLSASYAEVKNGGVTPLSRMSSWHTA